MGADIAAHYRAGREIIVVQVTDGAESGVRAEMCAQKGICLTVAEIVAARNSEQLAAMQHLAPTARIEYANLPDASLTVATASALIAKYVARYPTASFKTMSWLDDHPDHRALAYALRGMCSRIPSHDCRYEQFRRYWVSKPIAGYFVPGVPTCSPRWMSISYGTRTEGAMRLAPPHDVEPNASHPGNHE